MQGSDVLGGRRSSVCVARRGWRARRSRDRVGHDLVERNGRLFFASEIKSLIAAGAVDREIDLHALDHYLAYLYAPPDRSMFKGVRKLPPGHVLRWREGRAELTRFWQVGASETFDGSAGEAARQLRTVLADAVSSHMVSDVPLGAFLSGGVDSSIVVGLMAEASDRPVQTFSIGFDEPEFDELEHARAVAAHFHTDHHEFVVRPDGVSILDRLIAHFDEPFADSSAIPTWYVSEVASRHVTVVLSGDGGDELFGGYDRYVPHPRVARFDRLAVPGLRQLASAVWPLLPHGARGKNFLRHVARTEDGRYLDSIAFFQPDERQALYSPDARRAINADYPDSLLMARLRRFAALPAHGRMMRLDFETYLPEDVLAKVDRMSMAHSIESRVPLLDNHVIDFAASLPSELKIRNGRRKHILKEAVRDLLPDGILNRRKQGFGVPLGTWFRGSLSNLLADVLSSPRARQRGYFEPRFVERLIAEHRSGKRDHTLRLWQLMIFELWHREYLDATAGMAAAASHAR